MILFVSDMHFGYSAPSFDRASEAALIALLRAHEPRTEAVVLGGDVFDPWIEYASLVPKGYTRFLGLLANWSDRGIGITYVIGNHDPWHRDYFETELGVQLVRDVYQSEAQGVVLQVMHGDALPNAPLYSRILKKLLRHPVPVSLYRSLLPGDWGMYLARATKRRLDSRPRNPDIVPALRTHARRLLGKGSCDVVVMGHSHVPELCVWLEGAYLNTGAWLETRHFGRLEGATIQLCQWRNGNAHVVKEAAISRRNT